MAKEQEAANTASNTNNDLSMDAETAKQERQQENENKKNVLVEYDGKYFLVKNENDEKPIYESQDGEATFEFATKVAEEHNVEVIVSERAKEAEKKLKEEAEHARHRDRSSEGRRYHEKDTEGPRNVIVEDDGKYYIVRNEGDRAKLYESRDKEATLDFARKMAQEHEVDLIVLDRDRRVQLEEKYHRNQGEAEPTRKAS